MKIRNEKFGIHKNGGKNLNSEKNCGQKLRSQISGKQNSKCRKMMKMRENGMKNIKAQSWIDLKGKKLRGIIQNAQK